MVGPKNIRYCISTFSILLNTLSTLKKKKKIEHNKGDNKRSKSTKYPYLKVFFIQMITRCRDKSLPISGLILKEKAEYFTT